MILVEELEYLAVGTLIRLAIHQIQLKFNLEKSTEFSIPYLQIAFQGEVRGKANYCVYFRG